MHSEDELDRAVRTGAIDQEAAQRLRASVASQRGSTHADDENLRLVTGFNDVLVTIAAALALYSANHLVGASSRPVSALAYAVIAVAVVFGSGRGSGIGDGASVSAAVTGALLLAMSVFWRDVRHALIRHMPENLRIRLPEAPPWRA